MAVIQSIRSRRQSHKLIKEWGILDLNHKLKARLGIRIKGGPFKECLLPDQAFLEHVGPFLLGTYESELANIWPRLLGENYSQIVDIGSKFGYYAVGLAQRYPEAKAVAFDIDPWARSATLAMAHLNQISNLTVQNFCDGDWVRRNLKPGALMVCDCEGFEGELFDQDLGENITTLTAIIETHDNLVPGASSRVRGCFRYTHELIEIGHSDTLTNPADDSFFSPEEMAVAVREIRENQTWIVCIPKTKTNEA